MEDHAQAFSVPRVDEGFRQLPVIATSRSSRSRQPSRQLPKRYFRRFNNSCSKLLGPDHGVEAAEGRILQAEEEEGRTGRRGGTHHTGPLTKLQPAQTTHVATPEPKPQPQAAPSTPSVSQLSNLTGASPAPAPSAKPAASSDDVDLWTRAYEIFQNRKPELTADYRKHLASLQDDTAASADLSTRLSVECIMKQLLEDREKKQW